MTRRSPQLSSFIIASLAMLMFMFAAAALADLAAGDYDLAWHSVDSGGGICTGGTYDVTGSAAQQNAGTPMAGGTYDLSGGFIPGAIPPPNTCPEDLAPSGGNGAVDVDDLLVVINSWGGCAQPCPPHCAGDIAPDGGNCVVDVDDLLSVINRWGLCP